MGVRESKISFFSYEEVQRRGISCLLVDQHACMNSNEFISCTEKSIRVCISVNEDELKRLRLAFKRIAGASGVMVKSSFFREVLGESVPPKLAEVT